MFHFSLNSFIKISLFDTGGRISEIQKKLEKSGGYDFYNSFQRGTRAKLNGETDDSVDSILLSPSNDVERKYNREAYNQVQSKFGSIRSLEAVSEKRTLKYHEYGIEISVDPLFRVEKAGVMQIYSIWPTLKPAMSRKYGAVACSILKDAYKSTNLANGQFYFYDATKDKTYSEKQITNNTSLILNADLTSISSLLKSL